MNLDPPDICKLARVNHVFHRASIQKHKHVKCLIKKHNKLTIKST
jgi:hypothetical protein